jgi:hypothetical protein
MVPKPLPARASTAFVGAAALMLVGASDVSRDAPQRGTWNCPGHAGTDGGAPRSPRVALVKSIVTGAGSAFTGVTAALVRFVSGPCPHR